MGKGRVRKDLTGNQINDWYVIVPVDTKPSRWRCRCVCGTEKLVLTAKLHTGPRGSGGCGCKKNQRIGKANTTHGHSAGGKTSITYHSWRSMIVRCGDAENPIYKKYYLDKGIIVCDRWLNSFDDFLADMGPRPSVKHSLDRYPNKEGVYEPGNCRWATSSQQNNNRSNNNILTMDGVSKTIAEWSAIYGVEWHTLKRRITAGWTIKDAITTPVSPRTAKQLKPEGDSTGN